MDELRACALESNAWPFAEARKVLERTRGKVPDKGYVLFETGYGPSGLPHICTFGEVARTTMVRRAFPRISDVPSRLIAFSDDMDGLRKVPDNIPNRDMVAEHLGKPLTAIPDPFGTHDSFGAHNNARLRAFLDQFGFDYEFKSATECYRSGAFDEALVEVLRRYDEIIQVILPTLGDERRATYSPFLPISPETGQVLQAPVVAHDADAGTVVYEEAGGKRTELPVTGGHCKLQWKADWAMRWYALDVDYEMSGKDLIPSLQLSSKICRILGARPPENLTYELFLDENGQKISKSKGNGLSIDEWLRYGAPESLTHYMYQSPRKAKRLYFDVIPRHVDDYLQHLAKFPDQELKDRLVNPVWHVHDGAPPAGEVPLGFNILLNLASVCHADDKATLWAYISRYKPNTTPETHRLLDALAGYAVNYYKDFVETAKEYRAPDETERAALLDLAAVLETLPADADAEAIQTEVYEVGKRHGFAELRKWFQALYETLLGQSQGPRMGSFIALYGRDETVALIRRVAAGDEAAPAPAALSADGRPGSG